MRPTDEKFYRTKDGQLRMKGDGYDVPVNEKSLDDWDPTEDPAENIEEDH